ncbi:MAG: PAS domain S-box protein, partial [Actinomycetes bacterium]
ADSAADFAFTTDRDGRATWVARSVTRNFGWTSDELLGTRIADLMHPDDVSSIAAQQERLRSGLELDSDLPDTVVRMRTKNGQYRWVTGTARPLIDDDGSPTGAVASLRDVDDLIRAQETIKDSEARLRLLAENASDVVWQVTLGNITTWVSPSVEPTLGWRPDEIVGTYTLDLVHPDDRELLSGTSEERLKGASFPSVELRLRTADGAYRWMSLHARVTTNDDGSARDVIFWLRDVSEEVEARHALQASEARYRLLAENASDVVWQVELGGNLAWSSESVTSVLGWPREEILGKVATDLIHAEDRPGALRGRAEVLAGGTSHGEVRVLCADGSFRWMTVDAHPIIDDNIVSEVVTLRDIQDEVNSREQLRHALEHDPLTGLATQPIIVKRLDRLLPFAGSPGHEAVVAVLCVGVDHLSAVNEALTHAAGDRVLAEVGARISTVADSPDQVARSTGDEFVIILPNLIRAADAGIIAEQVRYRVEH